ncbi:MAG: translation elongation factor 4 [bacterium]|nr:translation elongation factor 4 [bacterium]
MEEIRNFCIIAHIDHGKSTLADRFLEITGTVSKEKLLPQMLDSNPIERERGITIKLAPVRMLYGSYILNLIDTPGHADFSSEVTRSLFACEGAILLVDATQGIQAQTISHYSLAKKLGLTVIPVVNKIDMPQAQPEKTAEEIIRAFGFSFDDILFVSAKTGEGVKDLLDKIIEQVPPPSGKPDGPFSALVFNSFFNPHLGVIAVVKVTGGKLEKGGSFSLANAKIKTNAVEIGYFSPKVTPGKAIFCGEVGFVATGLKELSLCPPGEYLLGENYPADRIFTDAGISPSKPMVFAGVYPVESTDFPLLAESLAKLKLSDAAISFIPESSPALGPGFRVGFLGPLHVEIVSERLFREFGVNVVTTAPHVQYRCLVDGKELFLASPSFLPVVYQKLEEPVVKLSVFIPAGFLGQIIQHCQSRRGRLLETNYFGEQVCCVWKIPLSEMTVGFYDGIKTVSSGFASVDYEFFGYEEVDAIKMEVSVNKVVIDAFSQIVPKSSVAEKAKRLAEKLKEAIPRQQFEVVIQVGIGSRILAAERISAFRKDVLQKLYGGDRTRKDKLLEAQKKGKKRMKRFGSVELPPEAFLAVLRD